MLVFANASVAMPGVNYESTKELPQRLKDRMRSRKLTMKMLQSRKICYKMRCVVILWQAITSQQKSKRAIICISFLVVRKSIYVNVFHEQGWYYRFSKSLELRTRSTSCTVNYGLFGSHGGHAPTTRRWDVELIFMGFIGVARWACAQHELIICIPF